MIDMFSYAGDLSFLFCELLFCLLFHLLGCMSLSKSRIDLHILGSDFLMSLWLEVLIYVSVLYKYFIFLYNH